MSVSPSYRQFFSSLVRAGSWADTASAQVSNTRKVCGLFFFTHHDTLTVGISSVRRESANGGFEGCTPLQLRSTYVSCYWSLLSQSIMFFYDFRCSPKYTWEHPQPLYSVRCRILGWSHLLTSGKTLFPEVAPGETCYQLRLSKSSQVELWAP